LHRGGKKKRREGVVCLLPCARSGCPYFFFLAVFFAGFLAAFFAGFFAAMTSPSHPDFGTRTRQE
jgi:hypothetical protein